MKFQYVDILGIKFVDSTFEQMLGELTNRIIQKRKTFVVTANPEIVMYAYENHNYKNILQSADYVVPDGTGIIFASKMKKTPLKERVTGFDLTMRLLQEANQNSWGVYVLGGKPEINKKAVENIGKQYPGLKLVGNQHGYFDWEDSTIVEKISSSKPDIVLVALGFPKQEQWTALNQSSFSKGIFIGVGGTIDILAGEAKRAPAIWRKLNLEWLYRLLKQPARWKRMLALPKFVRRVIKS